LAAESQNVQGDVHVEYSTVYLVMLIVTELFNKCRCWNFL